MTFHIHHEGPGVYKKFSGFVTTAEFLQSIFENHSQPDYGELLYSINDFLEVQGHSIRPADVDLASMVSLKAKAVNPNILIGVVTQDQGIAQLVRHYAGRTTYRLGCFATVQEARSWIATAK